MKIALDYDGTYTEDPELWDGFVMLAHQLGHEVHIVTMRYPEETIRHQIPQTHDHTRLEQWATIHYTSRQAKRRFMQNIGLEFQVWIDDIPEFILHSTQEALWPSEVADEYQCKTIDCNLPKRSKDHDLCVVCQRNNGSREEK